MSRSTTDGRVVPGRDYREVSQRLLLGYLAFAAAFVGLWAQGWPLSFYEGFPGGGRAWVAADGPFNEHLVRDMGGLQIALAVMTAAAVRMVSSRVPVALAWIAYGGPHLAYHALHRTLLPAGEAAQNLVSLVSFVAAAAVIGLRGLGRGRRSAPGIVSGPSAARQRPADPPSRLLPVVPTCVLRKGGRAARLQ